MALDRGRVGVWPWLGVKPASRSRAVEGLSLAGGRVEDTGVGTGARVAEKYRCGCGCG